MQDFRNVAVWNKAHALVLKLYVETTSLPHEEVFGVKLQLRRSGVGIASRIAEGCGRVSDVEFSIDLRKAIAGCTELEYLMILARDLHLWSQELGDEMIARVIEVRKMTIGLLNKL